jgi:fumarylacetoacetase
MIDYTHDPATRSWLESANADGCDFPIQNLPFSIFRRAGSEEPWRGGVAIGDRILDLAALARIGPLTGLAQSALNAAAEPKLNEFMSMGRPAWRALRYALHALLKAGSDSRSWAQDCLVPIADAEYDVPARIGDYTDFYTSIHHARTISKLFDPDADVPRNFRWVPTAYHGRVSSIGVSGQTFRRPNGQRLLAGETAPRYGPCMRLDYELELGVYIGPGNALGERIGLAEVDEQIFGLCLLNDWSARDIQVWEMNPLGPFHAKNFATTISPWVVTAEALAPFRRSWSRAAGDPQPLEYLEAASNRERGAFDVRLKVSIQTEQMREAGSPAAQLSQTSFIHHYWSIGQMITHHAAGGCNLQPGDLLGTGTISGPMLEQAGAMMELAMAGQQPIRLPNGEQRSFLQDGDSIEFSGWCEADGAARIGFGSNSGRVLAPHFDVRNAA